MSRVRSPSIAHTFILTLEALYVIDRTHLIWYFTSLNRIFSNQFLCSFTVSKARAWSRVYRKWGTARSKLSSRLPWSSLLFFTQRNLRSLYKRKKETLSFLYSYDPSCSHVLSL